MAVIMNPKFQERNASGVPYSGGKVYFYHPGTTTKRNTFTTSAMSVANANPLILDSAGRGIAYGVGLYKIVVTDANDVTIWSQDNVEIGGGGANFFYVDPTESDNGKAGGGSSLYDLLTALGTSEQGTIVFGHTGAANTTDYVVGTTFNAGAYSNVTFKFERGARLSPSSGVTLTLYAPGNIDAADKQQIFTGAGNIRWTVPGKVSVHWTGLDLLAAVATYPSEIYIPANKAWTEFPTYATGDVYVSATCDLGAAGVKRVYGDGANSCIFSRITDGTNVFTYLTGNPAKIIEFDHFRLIGTNTEGNGFNIAPADTSGGNPVNSHQVTFYKVWTYNIGGHDIRMGNVTGGNVVYRFVIDNCYFRKAATVAGKANIYLDAAGPSGAITNNSIWGKGQYGIYVAQFNNSLTIFNNSIEVPDGAAAADGLGYGVYFAAGYTRHGIHIIENHFENAGTGIYFFGTNTECAIERNSFITSNVTALIIGNNNRDLSLKNNRYGAGSNANMIDISLHGTSSSDYRQFIHTDGQDSEIVPRYRLGYNTGMAAFVAGEVVSQGGVTATVISVYVQSGTTWAGGNAAGFMVLDNLAGGNFAAGAITGSIAGAATATGAQTASGLVFCHGNRNFTNDLGKPIYDKQVWYGGGPGATNPLQRFQGVARKLAVANSTAYTILTVKAQTGVNDITYHGILAGTITLYLTGAYNDGAVASIETFHVIITKYKAGNLTLYSASSGTVDADPGGKTPSFGATLSTGAASAATITIQCTPTFVDFDNANLAWSWDLVQIASKGGQVEWVDSVPYSP